MNDYRVDILLPLPLYDYAEPWAMNAGGVVVGASVRFPWQTSSEYWPGLSQEAMGWPSMSASVVAGSPIDSVLLGPNSTAWAINNREVVAGCKAAMPITPWVWKAGLGTIGFITHAVWRDPATKMVHDLAGLLGFPLTSGASDMNDHGILVGWAGSSTLVQAISYDTKTPSVPPVFLGSLPGYEETRASAINNSGQIVGFARHDASQGGVRLFLFESGRMYDLGAVEEVWDINDKGLIVGSCRFGNPTGPVTAFVFDTQAKVPEFVDLGTVPGCDSSVATSINIRGEVVGQAWAVTNTGVTFQAFLHRNGSAQALDSLIVPTPHLARNLTNAAAINDDGYIVGVGLEQVMTPTIHPKRSFAFRLIPE